MGSAAKRRAAWLAYDLAMVSHGLATIIFGLSGETLN
jgi:hypothetical protein